MGAQRQKNWLLIITIVLCSYTSYCYGLKRSRTSPRLVAQRTGATRFEEYLDDDGVSSHEGKLTKRLALDPDVDDNHDNDFEIYQGVLGRPGVDFPVMTGIPKTEFSCEHFNNGYFADLETNCQVFHICDEGRKISFLCPNGTIFRQIDLICDWWFKVDCNSAPSHYAESSEQLQRAQRLRQQRLRHVVRSDIITSSEVYNKNDARTSESIQKPQVKLPLGRGFQARSTAQPKMDRRIDFNTDELMFHSAEKLQEIPTTTKRPRKGRKEIAQRRSSVDSRELVETAESAAALHTMNSNLNGYSYPRPDKNFVNKDAEVIAPEKPERQGYNYPPPERGSKKLELPTTASGSDFMPPKQKKNGYTYEPKPFNTRPTEKTQIYTSTVAKLEIADSAAPVTTTKEPQTTAQQPSTVPRRGSTTYQSSLRNENKTPQKQTIQNKIIETTNNIINNEYKTTTPSYDSQKVNTYSTARRPQSKNRETPFYTPTIPTVTNKQSQQTLTTTEAPTETSTKATNTEVVKHAIEMMETLKELDIESIMKSQEQKDFGDRPGIEVPPSSGPNALHSLALYFANTDSNAIKRMTVLTTPEPLATEEISAETTTVGIASGLLSDKTISQYENLFNKDMSTKPIEVTTLKYDSTEPAVRGVNNDVNNDLDTQHSKNPILAAAGTPQLRELAQVFTHALSAYLQDPETFRKILSEIRPTEPPSVQSNEILYGNNNNNDQQSSRYSSQDEIVRQESQYPFPTLTTTPATPNESENLEVLDFSDVTASTKYKDSTTLSYDTTTVTEPTIATTIYPISSETFPSLSSNLIDKTPGSNQLTENLEESANSFLGARQGKQLDKEVDTTPFSIPIPDEINGGLSVATSFPYDDSTENNTSDYFPLNNNQLRQKSRLPAYGFDVKPANSTPISDTYPTALSDTQAIPLRWGDEITTVDPSEAVPTIYSDLLPPYGSKNKSQPFKLPSNEILPPSEESEENLQRAQSQSIVNGQNNIYSDGRKSKSYYDYLNYDTEVLFGTTKFGEKIQSTTLPPETTTYRGHYVTKQVDVTTTNAPTEYATTTPSSEIIKTTLPDTGKFNTNSKTTLSYAILLDPFTINDGLMGAPKSLEDQTVTPSPNTYLPRGEFFSTENSFSESTETTVSSNTPRRGKSFATTPLARLSETHENHENSENDPMQRRANEMFGNLNETQAHHLMNVMKKADKNKTVRRLILLLIQTCDDDYNTTVEESRNALLNALIRMDENGDNNDIHVVNTYSSRRSKNLRTTTTTTDLPITTYKSVNHNKFVSSETVSSESTTNSLSDLSSTTSLYEAPTTFNDIGRERTTVDTRFFNDDSEVTTVEPTILPQSTSTEAVTEPASSTTPSTTTTSTTQSPVTTSTIESIRSNRARTTTTQTTSSKPKFRLKQNLNPNFISNNRKQKNLSGEFHSEASQEPSLEHKHADARALELLRSLYSIASRFG